MESLLTSLPHISNTVILLRKGACERHRAAMADIIPFDKFHRLKRKLPGFGTPGFTNAYAEARAFLHVVEGKFLSHAQLTHLACNMSPLGLRILQVMVRELRYAGDDGNFQR